MGLRIKSIEIENFKSYKKIIIDVNDTFNIIIGENNLGKTTIFEALLLWKKSYEHLIANDEKSFYTSAANHYINFSDLYFLRASSDKDIFHQKGRVKIIVTLHDMDESFQLGIEIDAPTSIKNSYFRMVNDRFKEEYERFAAYLKKSKIKPANVIFIYQTKPISSIPREEPYFNDAQILKKINIGKSHEVLRNKISKFDQSKGQIKGGDFKSLNKTISNILGRNYVIKQMNDNKCEYIKIDIENENAESVDISLMGSGFLQILEIFSTLNYINEEKNGLHILLIDEPDSHIHTALQHKLMMELRKIENNQIFVITHNDRFVNESNANELLYLNLGSLERGKLEPIKENELETINEVRRSLGGIILALEKLNYASNLVFVEGTDDIQYIKEIVAQFNKAYGKSKSLENILFFYLRGRGDIKNKIEYSRRFLYQIISKKECKVSVIFDKDFSTKIICDKLEEHLKEHFNATWNFSHIHDGYCIESTIFSDIHKLSMILTNIVRNGDLGKKYDISEEFVQECVMKIVDKLYTDIRNCHSDIFKRLEQKMSSQKSEERLENETLSFNDFVRDINDTSKISFLMNKDLIEEIINKIFVSIYPYSIALLLDASTIFRLCIKNATQETWYTEWNRLIEKL